MTKNDMRCKVAVVGYAQSKVMRRSPLPLGALALDTCARAIEDAGLRKGQVDGVTSGSLLPAFGVHGEVDGVDIVTASWISQHLGLDARWCAGFQGLGQITGSVILAINAIASGAADYVLVHRALSNPPGRYHENPTTLAAADAQWTMPFGYWGPPAMAALYYNEYMQRFGATREEMATLVVQLRKNVQRLPSAHWYGKPLTTEDYMNARMLAEPMSILDCDIPLDAVSAFVLTSAERAKDLRHRPVYVVGHAQATPSRPSFFRSFDEVSAGGKQLANALWKNTGLSHADIDVPQLYDGFTPLVYSWLECLGFCPEGEAHRFIQGGTIDVDGAFPLISGGGSTGNGRLHGAAQMAECYMQLSQRAGERQLRNSNVGIACHSFPNIGGAVVYSAEPL